jgi:hypothetical protein
VVTYCFPGWRRALSAATVADTIRKRRVSSLCSLILRGVGRQSEKNSFSS